LEGDAVYRALTALALAGATAAVSANAYSPVGTTLTATAQRLAPTGTRISFFGRPLDLAISRDGTIAVKNSHGILFADANSQKIVQDLRLTSARVQYPRNLGGNGMTGIAWNRQGTTVWSADGFALLQSASRGADGRFFWDRDVALPGQNPVPAGVALSADGTTVFVALSRLDEVAAVDAKTRTVKYIVRTGSAPFALLADGDRLYVANLGGDPPARGDAAADSGGVRVRVDSRTGIANGGTISVIDLSARRVAASVRVGNGPTALALSSDRARLFVANANGDSISVVDTASYAVRATVALPAQDRFGASPNALAVSPVDGRLYVAEGGDNRILVLDGATLRPAGETRTGWYPDGLAFAGDGTLFATSLKGWGGRGSDFGFPRGELGFRVFVPLTRGAYNVYDYAGLLQAISPAAIERTTAPSSRAFVVAPSSAPPVPMPPFKHVVFIIKENHTYDDYFGDLRGANGDPALCAFPARVSPNHHALARRFGIFDNFYVNGTMSADGHQWTDEAFANDYVERNTASWGRTYPSDGTDPLAYSPAGFIWQRALDAGYTFRDYGEFVTSEPAFTPKDVTWTQLYRDYLRGTHRFKFTYAIGNASLAPYVDKAYPAFTLRISDQQRASEFLREFRAFERNGKFPNFVLMQLGNDHTAGTYPRYPVPDAAVADNDLALGRIVSAVSHSRYWKSTAIFVVEDDAQNGLDHVDGHRTMALVISPYNKRGAIDSRFYNQTSILATIERILGLRPLTQFDAYASPIVAPFSATADPTPYDARPNNVPLNLVNPKTTAFTRERGAGALASGPAAFDRPDAVDSAFLRGSF
jgi:YVTN family beta-propeller protein